MIQYAKISAGFLLGILVMASCGKQQPADENMKFTKIDSLTDKYLSYNDSILQAWNVMINDDNQKIKSLRYLVEVLQESGEFNPEELTALNERINQLFENRYTMETLDEGRVEEYDFASNALVTEVTTLISEYSKYEGNEELQKTVDEIIAADQRVEKYRADYDEVVLRYNQFLEINKTSIGEGESLDWKMKPQFLN